MLCLFSLLPLFIRFILRHIITHSAAVITPDRQVDDDGLPATPPTSSFAACLSISEWMSAVGYNCKMDYLFPASLAIRSMFYLPLGRSSRDQSTFDHLGIRGDGRGDYLRIRAEASFELMYVNRKTLFSSTAIRWGAQVSPQGAASPTRVWALLIEEFATAVVRHVASDFELWFSE